MSEFTRQDYNMMTVKEKVELLRETYNDITLPLTKVDKENIVKEMQKQFNILKCH